MQNQEFRTREKVDKARREGIDLIDVRDSGQFAQAHIPGAVNIPWTEIGQYEVRPGSYLYCNTGHKSELARKTLEERNIPAENIGGVEFYDGELIQEENSSEPKS